LRDLSPSFFFPSVPCLLFPNIKPQTQSQHHPGASLAFRPEAVPFEAPFIAFNDKPAHFCGALGSSSVPSLRVEFRACLPGYTKVTSPPENLPFSLRPPQDTTAFPPLAFSASSFFVRVARTSGVEDRSAWYVLFEVNLPFPSPNTDGPWVADRSLVSASPL